VARSRIFRCGYGRRSDTGGGGTPFQIQPSSAKQLVEILRAPAPRLLPMHRLPATPHRFTASLYCAKSLLLSEIEWKYR
jgi:hypothetical protein